MSRDTKTLTTIIGIVYLCVALIFSPALVMYLLYLPRSVLFSKPFMMHEGLLAILIFAPCFLIAYGWIRRRKWARYLLIIYNGLWFTDMSYSFVVRMINYTESYLVLVVAGFLIPLAVLGGLIAFAFQKDVRALMTH
jgi:hypothetical protein